MDHLKQLIHEVHRRSLWQVTGIFLAAGWGVLQVVEVITETAGLPDWTPSMALVLLLIGLPVVLATAFVQEGLPGDDTSGELGGQGLDGQREPAPGGSTTEVETRESDIGPSPAPNLAPGTGSLDRPTTRPSTTHRLFTWKNAALGGVGAFVLVALAAAGYLVMWSTGIGPVGNLVAQGVIEEGDKVVLADFDDATGEGLGAVVTEALRVDLAQTPVIDVVEKSELASVLNLMQLEPGARLPLERAREAAERGGYAAVLHGSVATAGTGYLVTATLTEAETGRSVATFRASAADAGAVIGTIDELSTDIREKAGESLRTIRAGQPLDRVTTPSLGALRLYSEAQSLFYSDPQTALELLTRAVEIDPEFAMAWRTIAALRFNLRMSLASQTEAATRAYESRHRLTDKERYLAEAVYHQVVSWDLHRATEAYRNALRIDPTDAAANNNLGNAYYGIGEFDAARDVWEDAIDGEGTSSSAYINLIAYHLQRGAVEAAARTVGLWEEAYPDDANSTELKFYLAMMAGAPARADSLARARSEDASLSPVERSEGTFWLARLAYRQGRAAAGRQLVEQSARAIDEVAPSLAGFRRLLGTRAEVLLGDTELAASELEARLEAKSEADALSAFSNEFAGLLATVVAVTGWTDLVETLEARWREAGEPGASTPLGEEAFQRARIVARAVAGDTVGAVAELDDLIAGQTCAIDTCWGLGRATVARVVGDTERAIQWYESTQGINEFFLDLLGVSDIHAELHLGPLYEEAGDTTAAIEAYRRIVELWSEAQPPAREVVERYEARIRALGG